MVTELKLEELDKWYAAAIEERFESHHKMLGKLFKKSAEEIAAIKLSLKNWMNREDNPEEEKLDEKASRIMERFLEIIHNTVDKIQIPTYHTSITFENSRKYVESVNRLYQTYNVEGKKALKRFWEKFKIEVKEIDMHLRKLGKYSGKINRFIIKKYKDGKEAESVLDDIPHLRHHIERLGQSKVKIDDMEKNLAQMKQDLTSQEEELYSLGQHPDVQTLDDLDRKNIRLTRDFTDNLKFKKAFKKLRKAMEKDQIRVRDFTVNDIKRYMKSNVDGIIDEGAKIPQLKQVLIKTRLILEDENHPLNLKTELREKILENIHEIVNENILEPQIEQLKQYREKIAEFKKKIEKAGIEARRRELKEKIATLTADKEHFENDLKHQRREYKSLLAKIQSSRSELQDNVEEQTGEEVKIKIVIPS